MFGPLAGALGPLGRSKSGQTVFSPSQISGLLAWFKADAITGLADGAAVASWADSSGNSHDATQATSGKRPVYKTSIVNSLPTVRFTASSAHVLEMAGLGTALSGDASHSWFIVSKPSSLTNYPVVVSYPTNSASWTYIIEYDPSGGLYWGQGSGIYRIYSSSFSTSAWSLMSLVRTANDAQKMWKAGTEITNFGFAGGSNGLANTPSMSGNVFLGGYFDNTYSLTGDVAEVLCFGEALSDSDRQKIEGYLAHKYAQTSQLPAGHPYKSSPP